MTDFLKIQQNVTRKETTTATGSDLTTTMPSDWVVLLPGWRNASFQWGAAWDVHVLTFAVFFIGQSLAAIYMAVKFHKKVSRVKVIMCSLIFLGSLAIVRFVFFVADPYGFGGKYSGVLNHLLLQSAYPLLCGSYILLQIVLIRITGIQIGNKRVYTAPCVLFITFLYLFLMLTLHIMVLLNHYLKPVLLLDSCVLVGWLVYLCVTFICGGFRMSEYALEAKQARKEFILSRRRRRYLESPPSENTDHFRKKCTLLLPFSSIKLYSCFCFRLLQRFFCYRTKTSTSSRSLFVITDNYENVASEFDGDVAEGHADSSVSASPSVKSSKYNGKGFAHSHYKKLPSRHRLCDSTNSDGSNVQEFRSLDNCSPKENRNRMYFSRGSFAGQSDVSHGTVRKPGRKKNIYVNCEISSSPGSLSFQAYKRPPRRRMGRGSIHEQTLTYSDSENKGSCDNKSTAEITWGSGYRRLKTEDVSSSFSRPRRYSYFKRTSLTVNREEDDEESCRIAQNGSDSDVSSSEKQNLQKQRLQKSKTSCYQRLLRHKENSEFRLDGKIIQKNCTCPSGSESAKEAGEMGCQDVSVLSPHSGGYDSVVSSISETDDSVGMESSVQLCSGLGRDSVGMISAVQHCSELGRLRPSSEQRCTEEDVFPGSILHLKTQQASSEQRRTDQIVFPGNILRPRTEQDADNSFGLCQKDPQETCHIENDITISYYEESGKNHSEAKEYPASDVISQERDHTTVYRLTTTAEDEEMKFTTNDRVKVKSLNKQAMNDSGLYKQKEERSRQFQAQTTSHAVPHNSSMYFPERSYCFQRHQATNAAENEHKDHRRFEQTAVNIMGREEFQSTSQLLQHSVPKLRRGPRSKQSCFRHRHRSRNSRIFGRKFRKLWSFPLRKFQCCKELSRQDIFSSTLLSYCCKQKSDNVSSSASESESSSSDDEEGYLADNEQPGYKAEPGTAKQVQRSLPQRTRGILHSQPLCLEARSLLPYTKLKQEPEDPTMAASFTSSCASQDGEHHVLPVPHSETTFTILEDQDTSLEMSRCPAAENPSRSIESAVDSLATTSKFYCTKPERRHQDSGPHCSYLGQKCDSTYSSRYRQESSVLDLNQHHLQNCSVLDPSQGHLQDWPVLDQGHSSDSFDEVSGESKKGEVTHRKSYLSFAADFSPTSPHCGDVDGTVVTKHAQRHTSGELTQIRRAGMVSRAVQGAYLLTFVHLFTCLLQLYKAFGRYGVLWAIGDDQDKVTAPDPWPWLTFQTFVRLTELVAGYITLAVLYVILNHRHGRKRRAN